VKGSRITAMLTRHPFQKLCYAKGSLEALLAASGPYIICQSLEDGGSVTRWSTSEDDADDLSDKEAQHDNGNGEGERPAKRQRLSSNVDNLLSRQESEESVEIISERTKGQRRKPKPVVESKLPDVSHMLSTADGRHIVVVTADDKCIRVLERRQGGRLRSISERSMLSFLPVSLISDFYLDVCLSASVQLP
jgi:tRNA (guanine-N(7)-)-methyltransferase subunit TRM82